MTATRQANVISHERPFGRPQSERTAEAAERVLGSEPAPLHNSQACQSFCRSRRRRGQVRALSLGERRLSHQKTVAYGRTVDLRD
jgi:hypothetical protein